MEPMLDEHTTNVDATTTLTNYDCLTSFVHGWGLRQCSKLIPSNVITGCGSKAMKKAKHNKTVEKC
eukprot:2972579-Amphidinium_carterae.1